VEEHWVLVLEVVEVRPIPILELLDLDLLEHHVVLKLFWVSYWFIRVDVKLLGWSCGS
jgi:hypothetical protein